MKRNFWWALVVIILAVIVMLLLGMHVANALFLGACAITLVMLTAFNLSGGRRTAPTLPYGRNDGARQDISDLSWAFSASDGLSPYAHNRLVEAITGLGIGVEKLPPALVRVLQPGPALTWQEVDEALTCLETALAERALPHRKETP